MTSTPPSSVPALARRSLLLGGAAAAGVALTAPRADAAAFTTRRARSSEHVRRTFGTNIKCGYDLAGYSDAGFVAGALDELGLLHVRDAVWKGRPDIWKAFNLLGSRGVKINVVMGRPTFVGGTPEELVNDLSRNCAGSVTSFEGTNEWNLKRRPNWVNEVRMHQRRLYTAAKNSSTLGSIPVLGPSLGQRKDHERLGNMTDYLDRGNNHLYCGGRVPSRYIDQEIAKARTVSGSELVHFTESGYHNALNDPTTHLPTSEAATAVYMPRLLMEHAKRGVQRVYSYELIDQGRSSSDRELSFGLMRSDRSRKPAFVAIRRMLDLMRDPGPAYPLRSLTYGLSGTDDLTSSLLMQRRDGRFLLALWQDVEIWDPIANRAKAAPARRVTLSLPQSRLLSVYRPSVTEGAVRTVRAASTTVDLTGDLQIIAIDA